MFRRGLLLASALGVVLGAPNPGCNADNCLRAIRATNPTTRLPEASAFCSAFLSTSIAPVTVTGTATVISTVTQPGVPAFFTLSPDTFTATVTPPRATVTAVGSIYTDSQTRPDVTFTADAVTVEQVECVW